MSDHRQQAEPSRRTSWTSSTPPRAPRAEEAGATAQASPPPDPVTTCPWARAAARSTSPGTGASGPRPSGTWQPRRGGAGRRPAPAGTPRSPPAAGPGRAGTAAGPAGGRRGVADGLGLVGQLLLEVALGQQADQRQGDDPDQHRRQDGHSHEASTSRPRSDISDPVLGAPVVGFVGYGAADSDDGGVVAELGAELADVDVDGAGVGRGRQPQTLPGSGPG